MVVGGGGSGLVAAVAAAENGAKNIIVLEKAARLGGNAWRAVGMMAVESPTQKRQGIKSSRDKFFQEAMEYAKWSVNPKVVRAYLNKSGEIIGWLESKGMKFEVINPRGSEVAYGHGFPKRQGRCKGKDPASGPGYVGSAVVEAMLADCKKFGIKVLTRTKAEKILTDAKGEISGILAFAKDKELNISIKCVIIAAGGTAGNKEIRTKQAKYLNITGDLHYTGARSATGDGLKMAEALGAAIDERLSLSTTFPAHNLGAHSVQTVLSRPDILYVNKHGERFTDESAGNGLEVAKRQPGQLCFALVDSKLKRDIQQGESAQKDRNMPGSESFLITLNEDLEKDAAKRKHTWKADTLDELSELFGADPEILGVTVERYNYFCDSGYDADFVKDKKYLRPIRTPPYYAVLCRRACSGTWGGININERMEVISKEFKTISGLYATGNNAGAWVTQNYAHFGTALTFAFCSGYIAGENAAKYILKEE